MFGIKSRQRPATVSTARQQSHLAQDIMIVDELLGEYDFFILPTHKSSILHRNYINYLTVQDYK